MERVQIFLSTVSAEFRSYRDALSRDLDRPNVTVKVQEDFIATGRETLDKLDEYIRQCDAVIHLVGDMTGALAQAASVEVIREHYPDFAERFPVLAPFLKPGGPALSYTQWEAWLALYHGKVLLIADPQEGAPRDEHYQLDENQRNAQQNHLEYLASVERYPEIHFANADRLTVEVLGSKLLDILARAGVVTTPVNLPYPSIKEMFKGRDNVLVEIRSKLSAGDGTTAIVAKQAIYGLGGIGKTRLAVEYAWHYLQDYSASLFVVADSAENLDRNLVALCGEQILNLDESAAQEQEIQVNAVRRWLGQHAGWLLILDNVDTPEAAAAVDRLLPALHKGHVLITSRLMDWDDSVDTIPLDTLSEDDAVAYLMEKTAACRLFTDNDKETALKLGQTLGGLALALEQAGTFISKKHISFAEYLQRWKQHERKLLDYPVKHYPKTLAITWETSFEQLTPAAQALLNMLCWCAPDPIPRDIFQAAFKPDTLVPLLSDAGLKDPADLETPDLEDLLEELESLSLVKWESDNRCFSVHRLVQDITRTRLDDAVHEPALRAVIGLINRALPAEPPPNDVRSWPIWKPLQPHIKQLVRVADEFDIVNPTSRLLTDLSEYMLHKGLPLEVEPLLRRALEIHEASYGSEHPSVARDLAILAALFRDTNRAEQAEPLLRRALAIDEASLGSEHPYVARDLNNLASLLMDTKRLEEAEPLLRRALEIDEASYGSEHPSVARDLNNLVLLLKITKRLEEAERLMRRAMAINEASYGSKHPSVAADLNNLAGLLMANNRLEEAEQLTRRAIAIDEAIYGSKHPRLAIEIDNLAQLLMHNNKLEEAEPLMRRALAIVEAYYDSEHPEVAMKLLSLARLLQATNRLEEAEQLSRRQLEIFLLFSLRTGEEHLYLQFAEKSYFVLLAETGYDEQQQEAMRQSVIESVKQRLGGNV